MRGTKVLAVIVFLALGVGGCLGDKELSNEEHRDLSHSVPYDSVVKVEDGNNLKDELAGGWASLTGLLRSYADPAGLFSGHHSDHKEHSQREIKGDGILSNVKSFLSGIRDQIAPWVRPGLHRTAPAITSATEPLGRSVHQGVSSACGLPAKFSLIVGRVLDDYYSSNVSAEASKTCAGTLEDQTRMLVNSLKSQLKEDLCAGTITAHCERKFCNFLDSHSKLATLMVFSKLEVNPVGVALMRTTTRGLCTPDSTNSDLLESVFQIERLRHHLNYNQIKQSLFLDHDHGKVGEHDEETDEQKDEHKHEHGHNKYKSTNSAEVMNSCKACFGRGIHHLSRSIKAQLTATCQQATGPMLIAACKFGSEHKFLLKTILALKFRFWEIVSASCASSCISSENLLSQVFQSQLPRQMEVVSPGMASLPKSGLAVNGRFRKNCRLQAYRRALQPRVDVQLPLFLRREQPINNRNFGDLVLSDQDVLDVFIGIIKTSPGRYSISEISKEKDGDKGSVLDILFGRHKTFPKSHVVSEISKDTDSNKVSGDGESGIQTVSAKGTADEVEASHMVVEAADTAKADDGILNDNSEKQMKNYNLISSRNAEMVKALENIWHSHVGSHDHHRSSIPLPVLSLLLPHERERKPVDSVSEILEGLGMPLGVVADMGGVVADMGPELRPRGLHREIGQGFKEFKVSEMMSGGDTHNQLKPSTEESLVAHM